MRSLFRDAKDAVRFSTSAIQAFIPKHEETLKTARKLERIGLFKGARYDELSQRLYELELEHAFACQLAVLAAAEGEVRQLADRLVQEHRFASFPKLRKVLAQYDQDGLPNGFRALIEQLTSALKSPLGNQTKWNRLIDYRNWLAHGRFQVPPVEKAPTQITIEEDILKAIEGLKKAITLAHRN